MILLDTHALIWLHEGRRRARALAKEPGRLYASPATLLELGFLVEAGRVKLRAGAKPADVVSDDRWLLDEPPAAGWFSRAVELSWTRDPFDRLLVAHALVRGFRLATADTLILEHAPRESVLEI